METLSQINELLKEHPMSISDVVEKAGINWRTAREKLETLKSLGIAKEISVKNKRVYFLIDNNNYFGIPVKKEHITITVVDHYSQAGFYTENEWEQKVNAPTLSDIINSAEGLFSDKYIVTQQPSGIEIKEWRLVAHTILDKIFNNESIEEISEYIIKSIKE